MAALASVERSASTLFARRMMSPPAETASSCFRVSRPILTETRWSVATVTVSAYPNPVKDILNFSEVCDVTIVNGQGSVVKAASATTQISVDDLAAGYYIAKIKTADGTTVIPFIKK